MSSMYIQHTGRLRAPDGMSPRQRERITALENNRIWGVEVVKLHHYDATTRILLNINGRNTAVGPWVAGETCTRNFDVPHSTTERWWTWKNRVVNKQNGIDSGWYQGSSVFDENRVDGRWTMGRKE